MAEDVDECEDEDDESVVVLLSERSLDNPTSKVNSDTKGSTFICKEAPL